MRDLYNSFHDYKYYNIPKVDAFDSSLFSQEELAVLKMVGTVYGKYDAKFLEMLTHKETPWQKAYQSHDDNLHCQEEITPDAMKEYFHGIIQRYGIRSFGDMEPFETYVSLLAR